MIAFFLTYIISFIITCVVLEKLKFITKPFPVIRATKNGIKIFSIYRHKLIIKETRFLTVGDRKFLITSKNVVELFNVRDVIIANGYLYFTGCGVVEFRFGFNQHYKYFNINLMLKGVDFQSFKQHALLNLVNNDFDVNKANRFKNFINFIKNTLKIEINESKVAIFKSNLNFSYSLIYKVNNKIKRINVINSIGKIQ